MNIELLEEAKVRIPSIPVLVNVLSQRVKQLNSGFKPYIKREASDEDNLDLALREVANGKLIAEIDFSRVNTDENTI